MSYDARQVTRQVSALLASNPGHRLSTIVEELGISRHTIERACRSLGVTFLELRQRQRFAQVRLLIESEQLLSIKEIAARTGYTPRALARLVRLRTGASPLELRASSSADLSATHVGKASLSVDKLADAQR